MVLNIGPSPLEPGFFQITALMRPKWISFTGWFFVSVVASFCNLGQKSHRLTLLPLLRRVTCCTGDIIQSAVFTVTAL